VCGIVIVLVTDVEGTTVGRSVVVTTVKYIVDVIDEEDGNKVERVVSVEVGELESVVLVEEI
jgi:hypothetical protein